MDVVRPVQEQDAKSWEITHDELYVYDIARGDPTAARHSDHDNIKI